MKDRFVLAGRGAGLEMGKRHMQAVCIWRAAVPCHSVQSHMPPKHVIVSFVCVCAQVTEAVLQQKLRTYIEEADMEQVFYGAFPAKHTWSALHLCICDPRAQSRSVRASALMSSPNRANARLRGHTTGNGYDSIR